MDCMTHIWTPTLFPWGIIIFEEVLTKFNFLTKFLHLEKFVNLMKDLKYEHQSIFSLWGRVKLNFRVRYGKLNIFSKNSSHYQVFFTKFSKIVTCIKKKKKSLPTQMDLYDPYMDPYTIPYGYYNFPRSANKIKFLDEISPSGKIC